MLITAPSKTSSATSSARLDDPSMMCLSRAEEIIGVEVGPEELSKRQQDQQTAFKVYPFPHLFIIYQFVLRYISIHFVSSSWWTKETCNKVLTLYLTLCGLAG